MTIDYTKYTLQELHEAREGVNGDKYPEAQRAIEREFKIRRESVRAVNRDAPELSAMRTVRVDYTKYTLRELHEASEGVNGDKYPEARREIEEEIETRQEAATAANDDTTESHPQILERAAQKPVPLIWRTIIAWYFVVTGSFLAFNFAFWGPRPLVFTVLAVVGTYAVISIGIGLGLLFDRVWAQLAALVFVSLQLIRLHTDFLTVDILSYLGVYALYQQGGNIGINAVANPELLLLIGRNVSFEFGVNLLAIAMLYILVATNRRSA